MLRTGFEDRTIADGTLSFARSEEWRGLRLPAGYVSLRMHGVPYLEAGLRTFRDRANRTVGGGATTPIEADK
jgi:hypothetical protein